MYIIVEDLVWNTKGNEIITNLPEVLFTKANFIQNHKKKTNTDLIHFLQENPRLETGS